MINSKRKGKRGELEACKLLRSHGFTVRRGRQFSGGDGSPDIIVEETNHWLHWEVKVGNTYSLPAAFRQAGQDAGRKTPLVLHKRDRGQWMITVDAFETADIAPLVEFEVKGSLATAPAGSVLAAIKKHNTP